MSLSILADSFTSAAFPFIAISFGASTAVLALVKAMQTFYNTRSKSEISITVRRRDGVRLQIHGQIDSSRTEEVIGALQRLLESEQFLAIGSEEGAEDVEDE
jgi:hypothetical protein